MIFFFFLISDTSLGEGVLRLQAGLGLNPALSLPGCTLCACFPTHPRSSKCSRGHCKRLSQASKSKPGPRWLSARGCFGLLLTSPAYPGPPIHFHLESRGYQVYRAGAATFMLGPPKGTDTQAPAHRPPWNSQGFQCQNPIPTDAGSSK